MKIKIGCSQMWNWDFLLSPYDTNFRSLSFVKYIGRICGICDILWSYRIFFFFVFSLSTFNYWISYQMCIVVCKTRKTAWIYLACRRRMPQGTNPDQLLYSHCRNPLFDSLYLEFTVVFLAAIHWFLSNSE